jgi:hypothetical protein
MGDVYIGDPLHYLEEELRARLRYLNAEQFVDHLLAVLREYDPEHPRSDRDLTDVLAMIEAVNTNPIFHDIHTGLRDCIKKIIAAHMMLAQDFRGD